VAFERISTESFYDLMGQNALKGAPQYFKILNLLF
jgi:hypothetical protein